LALCGDHHVAYLCLHFAENGCAKYNGDVEGMENTIITIDKEMPGKEL
jgi:hypothetical protein